MRVMAGVGRSGVALLMAVSGLAWGMTNAVQAQQVTALPSGVRVQANGLEMDVTALRDDVVRVREGHIGAMPEDSSWAVLPAARAAHVRVSAEARGFHTKDLRIAVDPQLKLTVTDLQGHVLQQDAEPVQYDGTDFTVYKKLTDDEHFFGLGDKVGPLDRRGMAFVDWNTDIGWSESTDPIYKSIPFFYSWRSGRVLGVLFDNTWRASFDFGKAREHEWSFGSTNGPVTYYLMYGPGPKQVVEDYAWLTGPTPMPPLWSLGYQQSRYSYYPESRVLEVAKHLRDDKIPADVMWLDIDYQQNNRPFTVNSSRFPSFEQMIRDLQHEQFHTVVITDLHIADLPNAGYKPYDEGEAQDRFVKMPDGKDFVGWVWPGNSVFPNFSEADTRAWWGSLYANFIQDGIAGFWNDMNEPSVFNVPSKTMPDDAQHVIRGDEAWGFKDRTATHLEMHNVFGMLQTEGTYEGFRKLAPNVRPFVMTRASFAGGQRYSATWTGDNSSTWNHLRLTTPMLENLGLSGFAMAGADVGGFRGSPQMDLLTKWMEVAAFQPIDRDHTTDGSKNQEPWVGGSTQEALRRRYIETRYALMPYLYTTARAMALHGLPIVRPLFLEFPDAGANDEPVDLQAPAEFLFGPDLLVAPPEFPNETDDYQVLLPPGPWYDYWTGKRLEGARPANSMDAEQKTASVTDAVTEAEPTPITITPTLEDLPVYARGGSVIPEQPLVQSTMQKPEGPLTLRVYPGVADKDGKTCRGDVYVDDGISYAFEQGDSLRMTTTCNGGGSAPLTVMVSSHEGSYQPWWNAVTLEVYGWQGNAAPIASMAGKPVSVQRNATRDAWDVTVPDDGKGAAVELR
jgi:alpha-glucosidase